MTSPGSSPRNVKTTDGQVGSTAPMPDDRVLVTLDDGRSFVVDANRLKPQGDGTYLLALTAADREHPPSLTAR
jgi:hypothetical protein